MSNLSLILIWIFVYVMPALVADSIVIFRQQRRQKKHQFNALIVHAALLFSIIGSQFALYATGLHFPWNFNTSLLIVLILGITFSFASIGTLGAWYMLSSLVQELALLSVAFLLLTRFPFYLVVLLVVPVFVFSHPLRAKHWLMRLILILLWGILSLALFTLIHNVWIVTFFHGVLGALLIKQGILYPKTRYRPHI